MARPKKTTLERIADVLDKVSPEERAATTAQMYRMLRAEDEARKAVEGQAVPGMEVMDAEYAAPMPARPIAKKLESLAQLSDAHTLTKLARIDSDSWYVRVLKYDPENPNCTTPLQLDENGEPVENTGYCRLVAKTKINHCNPDVLGLAQNSGARGAVVFEFLGPSSEMISLPYSLPGAEEQKKVAIAPQAHVGKDQAVLEMFGKALTTITESIQKNNEQTQNMLRQVLERSHAPRQFGYGEQVASLEAERERIRAEVQAAALNDPKYKMGGEVMSLVMDRVISEVRQGFLGGQAPAAPLPGAPVAAMGAPGSTLAGSLLNQLKAGREEYALLNELFAKKEPTLMEQSAAVMQMFFQGMAMWQAYKTGGISAAGNLMGSLQQFAQQVQGAPPALGAAPSVPSGAPSPAQVDDLLRKAAQSMPAA